MTLTAVAGLVVFLAALVFIAARLATEFDASGQNDAAQRVERGLATVVDNIEAVSSDYSEWTAHYQALRRQDIAWIEENVGTAAHAGTLTQLVIVGGGALEAVHGWSVEGQDPVGQAEYERLLRFSAEEAERRGLEPDDYPLTLFQWVHDELWLISANLVVPHTEDVELELPASTLLLGFPLTNLMTARFGNTLHLSDVQIGAAPRTGAANRQLEVADGPPAWISWTRPRPGTGAIFAVALPTGIALGIIVMILGFGTYAVRRLALQLENALVVAEAASKSKSDFLATMSHELRTPLNAVLGMADLLMDSSPTKGQRDMILTIQEAGRSLLFLVNDVLDLARVESGKLTLEAWPFDLISLLARIEAVHGSTAQTKGIALQINRPLDCMRPRLGDEMRVAQILHNIVGNAVKFTDTGTVTVDVRADDADMLQFRVTDTGIGMTAEQVARVFEPFEQADAGTTRRYGGSGLGMAIVRRLIGMMGGSISVYSTPGKGTEIWMSLPLPETDKASEQAPASILPTPHTAGVVLPLSDCRLLVAEDNATNRKIMALMLEKLGVTAIFAVNGAEACALWREQDFDLVLMDISMPVVDGFKALEIMNSECGALGRRPPRVIAATANVMQAQIDDYRAKGFVDILAKPYQRADLQKILLRQFKRAPVA